MSARRISYVLGDWFTDSSRPWLVRLNTNQIEFCLRIACKCYVINQSRKNTINLQVAIEPIEPTQILGLEIHSHFSSIVQKSAYF